MNLFSNGTKIFAFIVLIFFNFSPVDAQTDSIYKLPAGTRIRLRMDAEINSRVSSVNDTFTTTVVKPVLVRDTVVLQAGTIVEGRITGVSRAAVGGKNGELEVKLVNLRFPGNLYREIDGVPLDEMRPTSLKTFRALAIAGGSAFGALIGAASKAKNGVLIGATIGAGAGTGVAFLRKGRDARMKEDQEFEIELKREVTLPVQDY